MGGSSYGLTDTEDTGGAATATPADAFEHAGTVAPTTGTAVPGKYYKVEVPGFDTPGTSSPGTAPTSYLRLGAVNPDDDAGETLAEQIPLPEITTLHTLGGVRDHTDGNRIITTAGDKIEAVGGQFRLLVNAQLAQSSLHDDPVWTLPTTAGTPEDETVASVVEHIFGDAYYELLSTTTLREGASTLAATRTPPPGAGGMGNYTEPVQQSVWLSPGDFYEYTNALNLIEVTAASGNLVEKLYGQAAILEVTSTVRASSPGWETTNYGPSTRATASSAPWVSTAGQPFPGLQTGDVVDYMFAENLTEVIRAGDLMIDRIYGDSLLEVVSTTNINDHGAEIDPGSLKSGDLYMYLLGNYVKEYIQADQDLTMIVRAEGALDDWMEATNGTFTENLNALDYNATYQAKHGSINENTTGSTRKGTETYHTSRTDLTYASMTGDVSVSAIKAEVSATIFKMDTKFGLFNGPIDIAPLGITVAVGIDFVVRPFDKRDAADHSFVSGMFWHLALAAHYGIGVDEDDEGGAGGGNAHQDAAAHAPDAPADPHDVQVPDHHLPPPPAEPHPDDVPLPPPAEPHPDDVPLPPPAEPHPDDVPLPPPDEPHPDDVPLPPPDEPHPDDVPLPPPDEPHPDDVPLPPPDEPHPDDVPLPPPDEPHPDDVPLPPPDEPHPDDVPLPPPAEPHPDDVPLPPPAEPHPDDVPLPPPAEPHPDDVPLPPPAEPHPDDVPLPPPDEPHPDAVPEPEVPEPEVHEPPAEEQPQDLRQRMQAARQRMREAQQARQAAARAQEGAKQAQYRAWQQGRR